MPDFLNEICGNCGLTYGSHHGGTSPWPRDYCPGHEDRMDWEKGPGTVFKSAAYVKARERILKMTQELLDQLENLEK